MHTSISSVLLILCFSVSVVSAQHSHEHSRKIIFPDVPGYKTISTDLHIHTVFSDGNVWPTIRVEEAVKDGIDAISLTEHLEYQPHAADMKHEDRNRSHQIAVELAKAYDLLVIPGAEITRRLPPGHANAVFIKDANTLNVKDSLVAYRAVKDQGGFVFWNHPNWISQQRNGIATLTDLHKELVANDLLHGIEVVNDYTYSDEALQIALDHDLVIIGTSDIHGLIDWEYGIDEGGHRPVTLVFSESRSLEGIQAGLKAGRTVAYYNDLLIGRERDLSPLVHSMLTVESMRYEGPSSVAIVKLKNHANAPLILDNQSEYTFHQNADLVRIEPMEEVTLYVKTLEQLSEFTLKFEILNGIIAPNTHPTIEWVVKSGSNKG